MKFINNFCLKLEEYAVFKTLAYLDKKQNPKKIKINFIYNRLCEIFWGICLYFKNTFR